MVGRHKTVSFGDFSLKETLPNVQNKQKIILTTEKNLRDRIQKILGHLSQCLKQEKDLFYDGEEIWNSLSDRGFSDGDIETALGHIKRTAFAMPGPFWSERQPAYRTYSPEELSRLSPRVRGFLWKLKLRGVIDHALEDEIVQKALDLEEPAGIREIKTVAALTVFGYEHKFQGHDRYLKTESRLH